MAKVPFSNLLHFTHSYSQYFLWGKQFVFTVDLDLNNRFVIPGNDCVREAFYIGLHILVVELATYETPTLG